MNTARRSILSPLAGALLFGAMWAGTAPAPAASGSTFPADARRSVTYPGRSMGTYVRVVLVTADSAASLAPARAAHAAFARVDSLMSNWTTTSEVARLNREAAAGPTVVESEVATVLGEALSTWHASDGAFDITVEPLVRAWGFLGGRPHLPSDADQQAAFRFVGGRKIHFDAVARTLRFEEPGVRIDLGGIAKGYAVDRATEVLRGAGVADALVDISGNMMALGSPDDASAWRIGIRDPRDRIPYFARLPLTGRAISTSGKYEQFVAANGKTYGHIMDPRTGRPSEGLVSVTVLAPSAMTADAWSTALFVLGPVEAMRKAREREDVDAVLVEPGADGIDTVWVEKTLENRFVLESAARLTFRVRYF